MTSRAGDRLLSDLCSEKKLGQNDLSGPSGNLLTRGSGNYNLPGGKRTMAAGNGIRTRSSYAGAN